MGEKGFVLEAVFVGCLGLCNQVVFVVLLVFVRVMVAL